MSNQSKINSVVMPFPHVEAYILNSTPEAEKMALEAVSLAISSVLHGEKPGELVIDIAEAIEHLEPFAKECGVEDDMLIEVITEVLTWALTGVSNISAFASLTVLQEVLKTSVRIGEETNQMFIRALDMKNLEVGIRDETSSS
ncbi:hypothetical protein [Vibrio phage BONAISHI]|nr:hypothetical protein [Vibrio phage BONAISHI]